MALPWEEVSKMVRGRLQEQWAQLRSLKIASFPKAVNPDVQAKGERNHCMWSAAMID
jgi:hypothetical protein